jgi:hypothetical protein
MNHIEFIYKILNALGWVWFFIKKPFKWFGKQNWKVQLFVAIIVLTIFDTLRFWVFDLLVWLIK